MKVTRKVATFTIALLLVSSAATVGIAATASSLNWSDSSADAPDPYIDEDKITVQTVEADWSDRSKYYNDNGEVVNGDFSVNTTPDNPYSFPVGEVSYDGLGEFPRKTDESNNSASALDASEWSKDASGSAGTLTVKDVNPADGVEAVQISTSGQSSGDVAEFDYSNFTVASDPAKRVLKIGGQVETLDSGATVRIRVNDSADSDYVEVNVSSGANAASDAVLANATGDAVNQVKIADLTVKGSGDGTMSELGSLEVRVEDADADLRLNWIEAEQKTETVIAEERKDTDSDDELETVDVTDPTGGVSTHALATLPDDWSDATLHTVTYPVKWKASDLDQDDVLIETADAPKYQYERKMTAYFRLEVPAALDLSHSGLTFLHETSWPEGRFVEVDVIEGAGDTDFKDLDWSSGSDVTSKYSASNVTVDDTVQTGTEYALRIKFVGSSEEISAMLASGGGGGGFFGGGSGGGPIGGLFDWIIGGILGLAGIFGFKKAGS